MKKVSPGKLVALLLFAFLQTVAFTQGKEITGNVTDIEGNTLPGVSIQIKGTTQGTITDFDGNYVIIVPGNATLAYSFVGFLSQEFPVGDQTTINVILKEDIMELDEIVVVGYGTTKKSDLTGAMSSLGEEDFNAGSGGSPEQMIQGRVAGVEITSNNGEPGAGASITVRGASTFRSGAQPLYVIDGIPMDMQNVSPDGPSQGGIGSTATNPLSFLNPDDIESIDILKDASAAAIYGSRGANGVIIVTTKKGKEGTTAINYSFEGSMSQLPKKLDVLTADEWRTIRTDTLGMTEYDYGASTDWQDQVFRTAWGTSHNLALSGGNSSTNYRTSFGYLDQEGIITNSDRKKYSARLSLSQKGLNERLNVESNLMMASEIFNRPAVGAAGYEGDLLLNALKANPTWPTEDAYGYPFQTGAANERVPTAMLAYHKDKTRTTYLMGGLAATLEITDGLFYKASLGMNYANANRFIDISQKLDYASGTKGVGEINNKEVWNYVTEHTLSYSKSFGASKVDLLAGYSYQDFQLRGNGTTGGGYATDGILYTNRLQAGLSSYSSIDSWADTYKMQSFFGRANYNYAEKYLLTFTLRADGSSKFGENNKYGYFPSAALAWRISQEEFIKSIDVISNLKLRAGWGQTGNAEIGTKNSRYLYAIDDGSRAIIGGQQIAGFKISRTPNPDISWETTTSANLGLDFGFFEGKISGSVDVFRKTTTDILLAIPAPAGSPTATVVRNIDSCSIVNDGLEINLMLYPVTVGDFNWNINANATFLSNIVNDLPAEYPTGRAAGQGLTDAYVQLITSGQPMNVFYGLQVDSISPEGDIFYLQTEPNEFGRTRDSLTYLGNPQPKFTWSITNTFTYQNFDLSFFIQGKHGNKIFNNTALLLDKTNVELSQNALSAFVYDEINYDLTTEVSDRYIEDGSYVRLSNATLGYTVNFDNVAWISRLRIYVSGSNLLLFTNYSGFDPDVNSNQDKDGIRSLGVDISSYPKARTIMAGVNVTF
ncbi:MAG: TonB-dependent receptor [Bacteroidales bacterium]|nr:TonB-dependent receptor [Bacteroidales bacterium]